MKREGMRGVTKNKNVNIKCFYAYVYVTDWNSENRIQLSFLQYFFRKYVCNTSIFSLDICLSSDFMKESRFHLCFRISVHTYVHMYIFVASLMLAVTASL